jgi:LPS-assembly protein
MIKLYKFSLKKICYSLIAIAFSIAITVKGAARYISYREIYSTLTTDTIPVQKKDSLLLRTDGRIQLNDTIPLRDTIPQRNDSSIRQTVDTFHLKLSKDTLDAPINYEASDSGVLLVKEKKFLLYGKTKTVYRDITLTAPRVELDQQTNVLTAYAARDSVGNLIARAQFQQGQEGFQSDTIRYNFKTKRGLTMGTFTKQSELFVNAPYIKKINDSIAYAKHVTMTTCDLDEPHFGFVANKAEFVTGKVAITGPVHPEFEGVPVPIYLPFGIFPLKSGRHSGLLPPQFAVTEQFGVGLEGLGYYHVLNEYADVKVLSNIYSYGGWSATLIPTYRKRYRYSGGLNLTLQHTKIAFKGDPDYSLTKTFNISWNHSVDPKATRGTSFSANVNAGSTKFNQYVVNNPFRNFNNQLNSSIAYSKTWKGKPYNLTMSANHNQNNNTHLINLILPDAGFTVNTIYPFQRKAGKAVGSKKWYESFGIGYSTVARNQLSFYDTVPNALNHILDTLQWGAQHRFPISMALPPMGPLIVSPFISYDETWITHRMQRKWDPIGNKLDTVSNTKGLFIDRQMSFGIGLNTSVYGMFPFNKGKIQVRHVMRPTLNMSYKPNLSRKYYDVYTDNNGYTNYLSQLAGNNNLFGGYGYGKFGGISFGVDNNLEMKKRGKKDTIDKKVRLIEGFGFTSGYNFLLDSMQLLPFNLYLRTTLFEKLSITAQGLYSPYKQDSVGRDLPAYVWQGDRFRLGRLRNGSVSMSTSFQSKPRDPKKSAPPETQQNGTQIKDPSLVGDEQRMQQYVNRNPAEFVDFNIPWSINLSYSLVFSRRVDFGKLKTDVTSNVSFNNTFSLTPKWMFTTSGYWDINAMELTMFTMSISRDMHCWQLSVNVTPIGSYKYFNISISPKSGILQDLKVNRTRYFYNL